MTSVESLFSSRTPVREPYAYIDSTNVRARDVTPISRIAPMDRDPREVMLNEQMSPDQPLTMMSIQDTFPQYHGQHGHRGHHGDHHNPAHHHIDHHTPAHHHGDHHSLAHHHSNIRPGCTPVTDLLLPETSTMVYTPEFFEQPSAKLFLQNVQPNIYSYSVDTTPINALASGITYTPQIPPKFRDQVYTRPDGNTYPIYTRIDPQLIRDDGVPARLVEQPVRGDWSAQWSSWEAAPGSVNYEDIYDGRHSGYGDPYRSYTDVNLGQVQYYYSDVDAYRYPNFVTRSKVDFVEYTDSMGKVKPYYERTAGLNDARPFVENTWMSDSLYHRENLMESQLRKRNAELWQLRSAPQSRAAHSRYFTQGAT